ncbi:MAG: hypothetical protein KGL26_01100 [Pseudomonadota bacterium]|nr:hypothetical protein [Pseudomonadota bacterium]
MALEIPKDTLPDLYRVVIFFKGRQDSIALLWNSAKAGAAAVETVEEALDAYACDEGKDWRLKLEDDYTNRFCGMVGSIAGVTGALCSASTHGFVLNGVWGFRLQQGRLAAAMEDPEVQRANSVVKRHQMQGPIVMPPGGNA